MQSIETLMKMLKILTVATLVTSYLAAPALLVAADAKADKKPKAYTLKTCPVSDEKLGEMGDPVVFTYEGREIKLCCKNCRKDFDAAPAKFVKKIEKAEKSAAK